MSNQKNHRKEKTSSKQFVSILFFISVVISIFLVNASVVAGETYQFVSKWGSLGGGDSQFHLPEGIAVDSSSNIYVADSNNHRVQKFDPNGSYLTQWGSAGTGNGQFYFLRGIAVDSSGNVYVADTDNNHRIQKFNSSGSYLTQWGSYGTGDGQFNVPFGITVDSSGNIYVADSNNHRIQKFDSNGNFITKWGSAGYGDGQFSNPYGVTVDSSGNVYVADTINHRVQKFDPNGNFITKWGSGGTGDGQFYYPHGITVDSSGNVYVADSNNHRIQKFNSSGSYLTQWGSNGTGDGQFNHPDGITVGSSGNVYVADSHNHRIQKFAGLPSTVCPTGCDFTTIQGAINAAANGDTVLVSPGTYAETINFNGKAITVKGAKGASQTIINGGGVGTVVTFGSGEGAGSILDGFTITSGTAMYGGGIRTINSSPTIKNNIITGNTADNSGGAISVYDSSSPVITNNTITGNTSLYGAEGISVARYSSPTITNNILWGNGSTEIEDNPNQGANTITATYNIVQGGYPGTGNINADPLFVNPASGDYHLQSGSPAIDTGMNTSAPAYGSVVDDIEGTVRPQDGDGLGAGTTGDGSDYDIGAYEYKPTAPSTFTLTTTKTDTGSGTITSSPAGINCGSDCSEPYNSGTTVTLTPVSDAGSFFTGWSGDADCSDGSVTMDADKTCTALFTLNAYNLNVTINPSPGGTVTAPGINCPSDCTESYNYNTSVPLTATANTGYTFDSWTGCDSPSGNQCTMTMNSDKGVTANFTPLYQYTLAVAKSGEGSVTVVSNPSGINCGTDCQEAYNSNTVVTLTVTPEHGTIFTGWAGDADCSDGVVTVDVTKTCWATFTKPRLAINKSGEGSVTVVSSPVGIDCGTDCLEIYNANTVVTLTVTPEPGTIFTGWAGNADCSDGVVTMDTPDMKTCWAIFDKPTLAVSKGGSGTGTVVSNPAGINCGTDCLEVYNANTVVTLTVTPEPGTIFTGWAGNADCSDGVVTMDVSKSCWAVFDMTP